jgi:hypothetical protein
LWLSFSFYTSVNGSRVTAVVSELKVAKCFLNHVSILP